MLEQLTLVPTISFKEWFSFLFALIAITHPVRIIPLFMGITRNHPSEHLTRIVTVAFISILTALSVAIWFGEYILHIFGITIGDFQVAGGIVLLILGLNMMSGTAVIDEGDDIKNVSKIAVVPLAIPWIASPGAFTTIIVEAHKHASFIDRLLINLDVLVLSIVTAVALLFATRISNLIGRSGIDVASKVMGLIVIAMAIEMFSKGLIRIFPSLV